LVFFLIVIVIAQVVVVLLTIFDANTLLRCHENHGGVVASYAIGVIFWSILLALTVISVLSWGPNDAEKNIVHRSAGSFVHHVARGTPRSSTGRSGSNLIPGTTGSAERLDVQTAVDDHPISMLSMDPSEMDRSWKMKMARVCSSCQRAPTHVLRWCMTFLHWNSVWFALYSVLFYLCVDTTIGGFHIYGTVDRNDPISVRTCSGPTAIGNKVNGELITIMYGLVFTLLLIVRRRGDPYYLDSYLWLGVRQSRSCTCTPWSDGLTKPSVATLMFIAFLVAMGTGLYSSWLVWLRGDVTAKDLVNSFTFMGVTMSVFSGLAHTLQVDRTWRFKAKLSHHWAWALISLAIIWVLSVAFLVSVDGAYPLFSSFLLHYVVWALLLVITWARFDQVFPSGSVDRFGNMDYEADEGSQYTRTEQSCGTPAMSLTPATVTPSSATNRNPLL